MYCKYCTQEQLYITHKNIKIPICKNRTRMKTKKKLDAAESALDFTACIIVF